MGTTSRLAMAPTIPHMGKLPRRRGRERGLVLSQKNKLSPAWGPGRGGSAGAMLLASRRQPGRERGGKPTTWNRFCGPRARDAAGKCSGAVRNIRPAGSAVGEPGCQRPRHAGQDERDQRGRHRDEETPAKSEERAGEREGRGERERGESEAIETRSTESGREASRGAALRSEVRRDCACTTIAGESWPPSSHPARFTGTSMRSE